MIKLYFLCINSLNNYIYLINIPCWDILYVSLRMYKNMNYYKFTINIC